MSSNCKKKLFSTELIDWSALFANTLASVSIQLDPIVSSRHSFAAHWLAISSEQRSHLLLSSSTRLPPPPSPSLVPENVFPPWSVTWTRKSPANALPSLASSPKSVPSLPSSVHQDTGRLLAYLTASSLASLHRTPDMSIAMWRFLPKRKNQANRQVSDPSKMQTSNWGPNGRLRNSKRLRVSISLSTHITSKW